MPIQLLFFSANHWRYNRRVHAVHWFCDCITLLEIFAMKKTVISWAALCTLSVPAFAQSSITLYGVMDMGVNNVSNAAGHSVTELRSGNSMTSRWGIRGVEDLGQGSKVQFTLESGIAADTGAPSSSSNFFNRQSWVGLSNATWGELKAGRQLSVINDGFGSSTQSTYMGTQASAVDGSSVVGASVNRFNNMIGGTRVNNSIKYISPDFQGLKVRMMVAMGEQAGSFKAGRMESMGVSYQRGSFEGNVAYQIAHSSSASVMVDDKVLAVGISYLPASKARISAYFSQQKNASNVQGQDANVLSLMALYPVQRFTFLGGYQKLNDLSVQNQDTDQYNLGVKYALSKRTDVYALGSLQKVSNGGLAGMFGKLSSNGKQRQLNVGIRHSF